MSKTVAISNDTHADLSKIRGELQLKYKMVVSFESAIRYLIQKHKEAET